MGITLTNKNEAHDYTKRNKIRKCLLLLSMKTIILFIFKNDRGQDAQNKF